MLALDIKAESVMSIASVHAGSFDIENEKLVFRAAEKTDNVSYIFEREVERLNEYAELYEWTFVSVCANKSTVFVAVNTPPGWVLLFEINAIDPIQFEQIEDKLYVGAKHDPYFGLNASVKMICCSGEDQAAVLIIDNKEIGSVWIRIFSVQRHFKIWVKCPVDYNNREQCIVMIACGEMHCAALTTAGDVFTCIFPMSNISPKWTISGNLATLDGGDRQRALQTIVDDMDVELRYKTDCNPMAASFGVTGGLRNPYLLNINMEGPDFDRIQKQTLKVQQERKKKYNENVEKELKKVNEKHASDFQTLEEKEREERIRLREVAEHENKLEEKGNILGTHEENMKEAHEEFEKAKLHHEEMKKIYNNHHAEYKDIQNKLNAHIKTFEDGQKTSGTHGTNTHNSNPVNNTISASSKPKSTGFGIGKAVKKFLGKTNLNNELHFEDIARFSASREHRCTYI